MAPNRKQLTSLLASPADLAFLQGTIQPKFLPLTHPKEEQQHVQRQQNKEPAKAAPEPVSASYWDWPAEVSQEEQTKTDLFSVEHLQSNLIQASNTIVSTTVESATLAVHDAYWAEESSSMEESKSVVATTSTQPQHMIASYWDWETTTTTPSQAATITIQKIVQEDKAHRIVSASLQVQPSTTTTVSSNSKSLRKSHDDYWSWESPVMASRVLDVNHPWANYWDEATESDPITKTTTMIQQIKDYEHARQVLTADHMVQQVLKMMQQQHHQHPVASSTTQASSDNYWSWSEPLGDAYWDTTVPSAVATPAIACGGCEGYWDM
jgi:hypothetical protein